MTEKPCTEAVRQGRLAKARQFLAAAESFEDLAEAGEAGDAYVTLCVHAGIAALDVICCARLGRYWQGDDHSQAITLLRQAMEQLSPRLTTLLSLKSKAGYTHQLSSGTEVKRAGRAARDLVAAAGQV